MSEQRGIDQNPNALWAGDRDVFVAPGVFLATPFLNHRMSAVYTEIRMFDGTLWLWEGMCQMPNKRYINGAAFERRVKKLLENEGYYAARAAGSHGLFDVVGVRKDRLVAVQCKLGTLSKEDKGSLRELVLASREWISGNQVWLARRGMRICILSENGNLTGFGEALLGKF